MFKHLKAWGRRHPGLIFTAFILSYPLFVLVPYGKELLISKILGDVEPFLIYPPSFSEKTLDWENVCSCMPFSQGVTIPKKKIDSLKNLKLLLEGVFWHHPVEGEYPNIPNLFVRQDIKATSLDYIRHHCVDYEIWKKGKAKEEFQ